MDRNTIIGFILIGLVLMLWMWLNAPPPPAANQSAARDSAAIQQRAPVPSQAEKTEPAERPQADSLGKYFSHLTGKAAGTVRVRSGLFDGVLSTRGAAITSWTLEGFKSWYGDPVNLLNKNSSGECDLLFYTSDGKLIDTKYLSFELSDRNQQDVTLKDADSASVSFRLNVDDRRRITKTYVFHADSYTFDIVYTFEGMEEIISNYEYQIAWDNGLAYQERNSIDESSAAMAYSYAGGELTDLDASKFDEPPVKQNISGRVNWVATRNKYFGVAMIARTPESQGAYLEGSRKKMPDNGAQEFYTIGMKLPYLGKPVETSRVTVYLGPLDFNTVKGLGIGLENVMSLGAAWVIRPITEYVMLPLFYFIHLLIPNYGLVIIVFSIIMKVVLYPLTKTSMKSMRKMQALQPMMAELKEKYKDEPEKMNQQTMRLYQEYGVNPMGGCLPFILQLPILYALYSVFRATLQLRQATFFWWIHDLSIPDVIAKLPFALPIFNITEVSGLAVFMGVTMFVQQKSTVTDPRQKAMVWMMPIMMTLLFNSFPSGLNLYYLVFNLLSIGQQAWFNKKHKDEPVRKVEKKKGGGFLARIAKDLPKPKG
jgi:YidC/Oxa1 family membrane protein insertase